MASSRAVLAGLVLTLAGFSVLMGCGDGGSGTPDAGSLPGVDSGSDPGVDSGPSPIDSGAEPIDAGPIGDVTYYGHVRPILAENCVSCHIAGGVGPFPLDTYETAQPIATRLMEVTRDRIMPPFLADNSGDCHTFRDARWLDDREIATLAAWDEQGEPMGDPTTPAPVVSPLPTLSGTTFTLDTGVDYAPDRAGNDDYRCFVVDAPSASNFFITGYEVHPGNQAAVHHVIVYAPTDAAAAADARAQDSGETGPGYTCFGGAGIDSVPVVLWAPGGGATHYPEGTGVRHDGGLPLIIQIHYNNIGTSGTDRTTVDIQTVPSGVTRARIAPLGDYDMALAPRMASVSTSATVDLGDLTRDIDLPITVYGHFPHMHTLGRTLRVELMPNDGAATSCLVDVPRWDFNWQLAYFYETPLVISSLDSVSITCGYDTTSRTDTVRWGESTQDEMCLNFFYMVVAGGL